MKYIPSILLFFFLLSFSSCSTKTVESELPEPNPPTPVIPEEPTPEKEKMLWFDAEANFERFSKKENITYYLDLAKSTGFNKIVVDVRPVQGDALFKSSYLTPLTDLAGIHIERDWDYLQFFIDEAHKRELKVTVSATIFTAGLPSSKNGMAYRDDTWDGKTCLEYTKDQGLIDIKDDKTKVSAFLNPVLPEVQDFCLNFIKELVTNYNFDGFALDYCRYPGDESDFSEATKIAFEQYIGKQLDRFPDDIFIWNTDGTKRTGTYYKKWWEFRSMVIRNFVERVRTEIKNIKPDIQLEYWAASWIHAIYGQGQNWASTEYDFSKEYSWASPEYKNTGFAGLLDTFLCGTYLTKIFGLNDPESIEYGIARAQRIVHGACKVYGTLYALNHKDNIADAVYVCLSQSEGLMVFDIVQVIEFNQWTPIKEGIQRAESL